MNKTDIKVKYDKASDVLYVTTFPGVAATSDETAPGVLWRHAIDGGRIVGVTILDFDEYWRPRMDTLVRDVSMGLRLSRDEARRLLTRPQTNGR